MDIDRLAAGLEPELRRAVLAAWEALRDQIPVGVLTDAVAAGLPAVLAVVEQARLPDALRLRVEDSLLRAFQGAAVPTAVTFGLRFDMPDLLARGRVWQTVDEQGWLRFGADQEWRDAAADVLRRAFVEGGHPYETARRIRDGLGLNGQQLRRLAVYEQGLNEAGMRASEIQRLGERFRARLVRERAETIARTETLRAAQEGEWAAWEQAAGDGVLQPDRTWRLWQARGDACPLCSELDGTRVRFNEEWPFGSMLARRHPRCRCVQSLVFDE